MVVGKTTYHKSKSKHNDSGSSSLLLNDVSEKEMKSNSQLLLRSKAGLLNLLKSTQTNYLDFGSNDKKLDMSWILLFFMR